MSDLRGRFEETETARFWMHESIRFNSDHQKYYSVKIKCSHYAQIINAAWMMFRELNK